MTVFGAKCSFAYWAAATTGEGPPVRAARIGCTYQNEVTANNTAAIQGTALIRTLRRMTSKPQAAASAKRIIAGRLYRAPSAGSIHPSSNPSWTIVKTRSAMARRHTENSRPAPSAAQKISGKLMYFEPHG